MLLCGCFYIAFIPIPQCFKKISMDLSLPHLEKTQIISLFPIYRWKQRTRGIAVRIAKLGCPNCGVWGLGFFFSTLNGHCPSLVHFQRICDLSTNFMLVFGLFAGIFRHVTVWMCSFVTLLCSRRTAGRAGAWAGALCRAHLPIFEGCSVTR